LYTEHILIHPSYRILFRDLKTENAARSHHGAFQILDFGLAKEIKEKDRVVASTDEESGARWNDFGVAYRLTGLTGTIRIMSPEVLQCHPYGLSADVYSFGIVIWEIFQGDRNRLAPVETIKGQRPALPVEGMPSRIESILKKVFADPAFRPTFAMLRQELEYQLLELRQEEWQAAVSASQEAPYLPQLLGARGLDIRPSNRIGELIALGSTP
jgi:serine/threonine protein kinase